MPPRASRQPISTAGVKWRLEPDAPQAGEADERAGAADLQRPPAPAVALDARAIRSANASLSSRLIGAGKWRITSGSALSAANGARSASRQWRSSRRSVRSSATPATASDQSPAVTAARRVTLTEYFDGWIGTFGLSIWPRRLISLIHWLGLRIGSICARRPVLAPYSGRQPTWMWS